METEFFLGVPIPLLSPLAIVLSACVAILVAKFNVNAQRKIARTRATSDIITKIETDQDIMKAEKTFKKERGAEFKSLMDGTAGDQIDVDITTFLNMYENVFLGIATDAYDELLIFKYKRGATIKHWEDSKGLINHWREIESNPHLFEMFELFATAWQQNGFVTRGKPYPEYYKNQPKNVVVKQDSWI